MDSDDINNPFPIKWKPVFDVRYVEFDKDFMVAVVRDLNDERLVYCVHPARVKCVEVRDE
jgi:hypothetical protein